MRMFVPRMVRMGCCVLALASGGPTLAADAYPGKAVRWIVPYAAGGGSDAIARTVSATLQQKLGQPVVVENRPGAGTAIGMGALLSQPADGYAVATADVGTLAFNPWLYASLPYDPKSSFQYVGGLVRTGFLLVTRDGLAVATPQAFIELARKSPGQLSYASAGTGSPHHMAMEMLEQRAGIDLLHIPYKGGAPAMQAVMAGQVDAMMLDLAGGLAHLGSGRFRVLGLASTERHPRLPEVPTLAESGVPDVVAYSWQVVVAREGTPPAVVARLATDLQQSLEDPGVRRALAEIGAEAMPLPPAEAAALVAAEGATWGPVIRAANITLD